MADMQPMNKGEGENSYAKNSTLQMGILMRTIPIIKDIIKDMFVNHSTQFEMVESFSVADIGCASGTNSLLLVSEVIDTIHGLSQNNNKFREIVVLLNDRHNNDFNTIFTTLPSFYLQLKEKFGYEFSQKCFIAGVGTSFYERIFPSKSLHFVHSSNSLHWLSQVPKSLDNKTNICITKTCAPHVFDAYKDQFYKDFSTFLSHRSREIVSSGRMILTFMGRNFQDLSKESCYYIFELLGQSLYDAASQGFIKNDDVDSFNLPIYPPSKDEVERIIAEENSFDLEKMKIFKVNWDPELDDYDNKFDKKRSGQNVSKCVRAAIEPMLLAHFGEFIFLNNMFERYAERLGDHLEMEKTKIVNISICLTRK